ncbi:hypothetical protein KR054_009404 [Drosophila jambulina]|nr:hypothetical protein KR054_009404 [Drosophila jambulina]
MASECRICCEKIFTPHPKNLFEKRNHRILTAIQQITGLEIVLEAPLPKHICSCCLLDLSHAVAFRQRCLQADEYLHRKPSRSIDDSAIKEEHNLFLKRELDEDDCGNSYISEDKDETASPREPSPVSKKIKDELRMPNSQSPRVRIKRLHVSELRKPTPSEPKQRAGRKRLRRPKVYPKDKKYVCDQCGWAFADMSNMKDHKLRHFEKKHVCNECGRKFYTQPLLRLHIRVHHKGEKPYVCKYCGKGFNNSPARCRHERSKGKFLEIGKLISLPKQEPVVIKKVKPKCKEVENITPVQRDSAKACTKDSLICDKCGKFFKSTSNLKMHQVRHGDVKDFACTSCDLRFVNPYLLKTHVRVRHLGETPYACQFCEKKFFTSSTRSYHQRTQHIRDWSYECDLCDNKFNTKTDLNRHKYRHAGHKPFR